MVASVSLFAFVVGNMVGQHGWYAFWKTVLGKEDDSQTPYAGLITPVEKVPDYTKWAKYGGDPSKHTFAMVPQDVLVPLPEYDTVTLRTRGDSDASFAESVYSVGNLGDYQKGSDRGGSHVGVDVRLPLGTPIRSIGNGRVVKAVTAEIGFGHYVMIRHPNVPDPTSPGKRTSMYSIYAHLDAVLVSEGQIVHKGERIGTSGQTGFASGPHLHLQIDRDEAPYHPFWPFTSSEASEAKMTFTQAINAGLHQERGELYTVSPLVYIQNHMGDTQSILTTNGGTSGVTAQVTAVPRLSPAEQLKLSREERLRARLSRAPSTTVAAAVSSAPVSVSSSASSVSTVPEVIPAPPAPVSTRKPQPSGDVATLSIEHSGKLLRAWQNVRITAYDATGKIVKSPSFSGRLYLIPEFGDADIKPKELSSLDFVNGVATVQVLPRGKKTVFISTKGAFTVTSEPLVAER